MILNTGLAKPSDFDKQDLLAVYDGVLQECERLTEACRGLSPLVKTLRMLSINAVHSFIRDGDQDKASVLGVVVADLQLTSVQLSEWADAVELKADHIEMLASNLVLNLSRSTVKSNPQSILFKLQQDSADLITVLNQLAQTLLPLTQTARKAAYIAVISSVDVQQQNEATELDNIAVRIQAWGEGLERLIKKPVQATSELMSSVSQYHAQVAEQRLALF